MNEPVVYLASILALGIAAQWIAWRLRLPAIVLLLVAGFALGRFARPDEFIQNPNVLLAIVSLSVAVILFEGGLSLQLSEIRETRGVVIRLVTIGLIITWLLTTAAAQLVLGFDLVMALLAGALFTVSGPTVIIPLLRHVRPVRRIGSLVKWEGIVNDPIGAVLAALVFEVILHRGEHHAAGETIVDLATTAVVGGLLGAATAWLLVHFLKRYWVPDYLQSAFFLAVVLAVFVIANHLQSEAGLVTVTIMGVCLANQRTVTVKHVVEFKENLRVLLISTLFIVLASRLDWQQMRSLGGQGLLFLAVLILLVRPLSAIVATIGSELKLNERLFLAWIHPRGIVAAAVASLFALQLSQRFGNQDPLAEQAERLVSLTFLVIAGTVTVYGLSAGPVARRLKLSRENPQGVLFAGAEPFVQTIATALKDEGYQTLLVDTNHQKISTARMAGLPVCYANIGSEYVHDEIDLGDIGRLLAMTPSDEVNTLATLEFAEQFSRAEVYQLPPPEKSHQRQEGVPTHRRGRLLFDQQATFHWISERFRSGATLKKTLLTDDFTYEDFQAMYGPSAQVLFLIEEQGKLTVCTADTPPTPKPGQKLISLVDLPETRPENPTDPQVANA